MCDKVLRWVVDNAATLPIKSSGEYVVLMVIARRCNPQSGLAWPSLKDLAALSRLSEQVVRRHIHSLSANGVISTTSGGGSKTNHYTITGYYTPTAGDTPTFHDRGIMQDYTPTFHDTPTPTSGDTPTPTFHDTPPLSPEVGVNEIEKKDETKVRNETRNAGARLRAMLANENPDYGYRTDEVCADSVWGVYPKAGRKNRPEVLRLVRGMDPADWRSLYEAARNYALSSVAERGMITSLPRWIEGEDWRAYVDGPILDQKVKPALSASQEGREYIHEVAAQARAYRQSLREITREAANVNGNGYTGLDQIPAGGVRRTHDRDSGGFGALLSFPTRHRE